MRNPLALAFGGMAAMAIGIGVGRFVYTPILPIMAESLRLTTGQTGLIASANFLGYLVGALAAASNCMADARRTYLMAALAANAAAMAAMGMAKWFWLFLALRFLGGVASAFILVFASALVLEQASGAGRGWLSSVHFAGVGVGIAVSAVAVALLARWGFGWAAQWEAAAILSAVGAVLVAMLVPRTEEAARLALSGAAAVGALNAALVKIIVAYGLFGFGYVITATFLVTIARAGPQTAAMEPVIWALFGLVAAPSVALWNWIASRCGVHRAFALACVLESVGVLASVMWLSQAGALVGAALLGGTFMGITALGLIAARGVASGDARRILALMTAAFGLGQIVGPGFAGFVHDGTGSFTLPSIAAAGALGIAALLVATLRVERAPAQARS